MLPVLPKVTKLKQKQIAAFGGIDKRESAKENSFCRLVSVDNPGGTELETYSSFPCAIIEHDIQSDNLIMVDNDEGGKDIYYLGDGGFYKNGVLLPFDINVKSKDVKWPVSYFPDIDTDEQGVAYWKGDYSKTKLIRYNECVFAVPQMIYTDGEKTYTWGKLSAGNIAKSELSFTLNHIVINAPSKSWKKAVLGRFKVGEAFNVYVDGEKKKGSFRLKTLDSTLRIEIDAFNEEGERYGHEEFYGSSSESTITVAFELSGLGNFVDADVIYNRMWGVSGNRVYASHLADPFRFEASDGTESDSWWADTEDRDGFVSISNLNGRVVAFKRNSAFEIYGTVNPYTIKDVNRSVGCICRSSLKEVNGTLFLLTGEGMSVYGGSKFVNINETLCSEDTYACGASKGSKYYVLMKDGVFKYDYYSGLWTNVMNEDFDSLIEIDFDIFGFKKGGTLIQLTGEKKNFLNYVEDVRCEWEIESTSIGSGDFYAEGINKLELRFETEGEGRLSVEISRDGGAFEPCSEIATSSGWQICSVPISFIPCSTFRYRIKGSGKLKLRLINYSYRKGGRADRYE